jgi:hypothetical protein
LRTSRARAAAAVPAVVLLLYAACGPRSLSVRSVPFPSEKPVFVDAAGAELRRLPDDPEPARLVLLDFPWCNPGAETWTALREASRTVPPGSARVYRILFDRERLLTGARERDAPPLRAVPAADAGALPVTTLTAVPGAFRDAFRVEEAPVLLLLDRDGRIVRRWIGYSPSLAAAVASAVTGLSSSFPLPGR